MASAPRTRVTQAGVVNDKGAWQAEKSLMTRTAVLEATIACLIKVGYTQTTVELISQEAGVSRGAMTHHFKSRLHVLAATAEFVTGRRAQEYSRAIDSIKVPVGALPTPDHFQKTILVLQKYYGLPSFVALHELMRGARTDVALKAIMAPLEKHLDSMISDSMLEHFPYLAAVESTRQVLMDMIMRSLQCISIDLTPTMKGPRRNNLLHLLGRIASEKFTLAFERAETVRLANGA